MFVHFPKDGRAGGVGIALAKIFTKTKSVFREFLNFECLEVHLRNENETLALSIIYKPLGYAGTNFKEEFEALLMHTESTNTWS